MQHLASDALALTHLLDYSRWNVEVGREVIAALIGLGDRAGPALAEVLLDSRRARVTRMAAAWLLGDVRGEDAHDALCRARLDEDDEVADTARRALDRLGRACTSCLVPSAA